MHLLWKERSIFDLKNGNKIHTDVCCDFYLFLNLNYNLDRLDRHFIWLKVRILEDIFQLLPPKKTNEIYHIWKPLGTISKYLNKNLPLHWIVSVSQFNVLDVFRLGSQLSLFTTAHDTFMFVGAKCAHKVVHGCFGLFEITNYFKSGSICQSLPQLLSDGWLIADRISLADIRPVHRIEEPLIFTVSAWRETEGGAQGGGGDLGVGIQWELQLKEKYTSMKENHSAKHLWSQSETHCYSVSQCLMKPASEG